VCPGDGRIDVVAGKRPADQAAAAYAIDAEGTRHGRLGLPGIGLGEPGDVVEE
jgi:hypothetical protein